jgi:ferredoxin
MVARESDCGALRKSEGWNNLAEPSVLEDKILRENMAGKHNRLACQARVLGGTIKVRPVKDTFSQVLLPALKRGIERII